MKAPTISHSHDPRTMRRPAPAGAGFALVLVLAILVLAAGLVIAFLIATRSERSASSNYKEGVLAQQIADSTISIVQGQIAQATAQPDHAWASQPGMIRTWRQNASPGSFFKLYSAPELVINGADFNVSATDLAPGDWDQRPGQWVDLNEPVVTAPDSSGNYTGADATRVYPIVDPAAQELVDGFSIDSSSPISSGKKNAAPMPVSWLYLLADGSLTTPTAYDTSTGEASGWREVPSGSSTAPPDFAVNPIVGRIAFWTDDDTCKLNINTASEGVFWDAPAVSSKQDYAMAMTMPVPGEFQRAVGHPATTSLSPVLGGKGLSQAATPLITPLTTAQRTVPDTVGGTVNWNLTGQNRNALGRLTADSAPYTNQLKPYYDLIPRVYGDKVETTAATTVTDNHAKSIENNPSIARTYDVSGDGQSSQGGTHYTLQLSGGGAAWATALTPDADRLFASVPELLFEPKTTGAAAGANRPEYFQPDPGNPDKAFLASGSAEQARTLVRASTFFLTTNSRAPETTLFNTPRICLWPIQVEPDPAPATNILFPQERLLRFCASVGRDAAGKPALYAFQRVDLARNGGQPPSGTTPTSTDTTRDYDAIPRNQKLMDTYFRNLMAAQIPGYGGSFQTKWSADGMDGMRVALFDTIRSSLRAKPISRSSNNENSYSRSDASDGRDVKGFVVPLRLANHKGYSNQPLVSGVSAVFINSSTDATTNKMQFYLLFQMYFPDRVGVAGNTRYRLYVEDADSLTVTAAGASGPAALLGSGNRVVRAAAEHNTTNFLDSGFILYKTDSTGFLARRNMRPSGAAAAAVNTPLKESEDYPFVSNEITLGGTTGDFTFSGGTITVHVVEPDGPQPASLPAVKDRVQTVQIRLPSYTGPLPLYYESGKTPGLDLYSRASTGNTPSDPEKKGNLVKRGDILKGVGFGDGAVAELRGDLRALAMATDVKASSGIVAPHPDYNLVPGTNPGSQSAFYRGRFTGFTVGNGGGANQVYGYGDGSSTGPLNQGIDIWASVAPINGSRVIDSAYGLIPGSPFNFKDNQPLVAQFGLKGARNAKNQWGDWTSGVGGFSDGAITAPLPGGAHGSQGGGFYYPNRSSRLKNQTVKDFSPNIEAPSPVIFGPILTPNSAGIFQGWTTLLFNPAPAAGLGTFGSSSTLHPGFETPPDHLILDNFWMPIVEPYAISEPLSTAGKVNLNYQMWPFPHISRTTAMRGVLTAVQMAGLPDSNSDKAKRGQATSDDGSANVGNLPLPSIRHALNLSSTTGSLADFKARFDAGKIFKSASEICEVMLVPEGETRSNMASWWSSRRMTSDTLRESPYLSIYPRVTTKSNSYTVHYWVQSLKHSPASRSAGVWTEGRDGVLGEYRGNASMERYIDPNDSQIPDYLTASSLTSVDPIDRFYRWRIVSKNRFAP